MPISYVNGAPPKETPLIDERGRVTAPWFAYLVGLQKSNSGIVVGAGGLNINGETISGDATFAGAVLFGGGISFADEAGARLALGLGSAAVHAASDFDLAGAAAAAAAAVSAASLQKASNLSDVANAATARGNLGLGSAATHSASDFDTAGAAAAAQAAAIAASDTAGAAAAVLASSVQKSANLSDLLNAGTARTNLGLGSAATQASSAFDAAGAAAAVLASSVQKSANLSDLLNAGTARTNLGLGSAATQASSAFDAAGAAAAAQAASLPVSTVLPANEPVVSHQFLNAYNSLTGAFTQAQPAFADISGTATKAQQHTATVYSDQANTFGAFAQQFGGSVGIGAAPSTQLQITQVGSIAPVLRIANDGSATFTPVLQLYRGSTDFSEVKHAPGGGTVGGLYLNSGRTTATDANTFFQAAGVTKMMLVGAGRLLLGTTTDNSVDQLQVVGSVIASTQVKTAGLVTGLRTVTAADTATTSDHTILGNISGAVTETLPAAPLTGQEFYLVNVGSAVWTVAGNGKNIWAAGASSASITLAANTSAILKYDGALWRRIV